VSLNDKTAFVTGAAHRLGAQIARTLHAQGANIALHYRRSKAAAERLVADFNTAREGSAAALQADLLETNSLPALVDKVIDRFGALDVLVNNASMFYPTELGTITERNWDELVGSNLKAPLFLSQAAAPWLRQREGVIINIVDIHAQRPLKGFPVYSVAKAGLAMLTKALARELGPEVRVNGVAPGLILWPEHDSPPDEQAQRELIEAIPLRRTGHPEDIARTVLFLVRDADYISGQIIAVDGGRTLRQ
jgi:pteridine reductase